jgi:4-diphosphocytidyl-2C-methyl-D-erythritol kinase
MSGSGSAVFGLLPDESAARTVADRVQSNPKARRWHVGVVDTLSPGTFPFLDG